jgi:TRAP-type C4-dicarboxylate transport system substrate-binding protein
MKFKRLLALLLAAMMVLGMTACGTSSSTAEASTTTEATETETTEAEAAGSTETAAVAETVACDPLTINFSTTFNETELGGQTLKHFEEYLSEITDGAITINFFWGGTLFTDAEALDGVSSGSVDMTALGHMPHLATLNYLAFPGFAPGSSTKALEYFDELIFNNAETSALIQGEAADNNIIYLNVIAGGANAYCTTYEFTDLASMVSGSKAFGNFDATIFETLGFQVSAISPSDMYDALQRGLVDSTQMALAAMVSMGWADVADYWALDGTYTAGNMFTANLDWWNSLTDAQREAIQAAATEVEEYSAGIYDTSIEEDLATVEATTGHPVVELSQEDIDTIWAASFEAKADSALETAALNGKTEGMTKILEVAAEFTGYNWEH